MIDTPEGEVRKVLDRLLRQADWSPGEISQEQNLETGRLDYRLENLCILEAKKAAAPDKPELLKLHLVQAQRYARSVDQIPFLMVSDGELHYLQDRRTNRIERLFTLPTRQQLTALLADQGVLVDGYIITPDQAGSPVGLGVTLMSAREVGAVRSPGRLLLTLDHGELPRHGDRVAKVRWRDAVAEAWIIRALHGRPDGLDIALGVGATATVPPSFVPAS